MIPKQALLAACVSACLVTACGETGENASGRAETDAGPPEKTMATDENGAGEATRKPATPEERSELRKKMAGSASDKTQFLDKVRTDAAKPVSGEVPDELLKKIIADLAAKIGADPADIEVLRAESLTWNDGSLGCATPGQNYTQALVPGYHVILGHKGQPFDYRASEKGYFMLCEKPMLAPPGVGSKPPVQ